MADILHQVLIKAPAKKIYQLIATREGIQQWLRESEGWKISGDTSLGGLITFYLETHHHIMKVIQMEKDKQVRWECTEGHPEWLGTTVDFFIDDNVSKCTLEFAHNGWADSTEFFQECQQAWAGYVEDIKRVAEGTA